MCNRRYGGEKPGPRRRPVRQLPADGAGATAACLSSRKGTTPLTPSPSPVHWSLFLYNMEDGAEGRRGSLRPQGRSWARESEEGHCSAVEVVSSIRIFTAVGPPTGKRAKGIRIPYHRNLPDLKGTHWQAPSRHHPPRPGEQSYKFQTGSAGTGGPKNTLPAVE